MNYTPREADEMTLWEMGACSDGINRANGGDDSVQPPSNEEFDLMLKRYDERGATRQ